MRTVIGRVTWGPKKRPLHYSYDESANESAEALEEEAVQIEEATPAEDTEPIEHIEPDDTSAPPS
jgi:hypothetical protein